MDKIGTTLRQGDVALVVVAALPQGCEEVKQDGNRIVLAFGESTGHAHAIYDHRAPMSPGAALEIAEAVISRAQAKARLLLAPNGDRYLDVRETVHLLHEEHEQHTIAPGIYLLPVQMEHIAKELIRVAD